MVFNNTKQNYYNIHILIDVLFFGRGNFVLKSQILSLIFRLFLLVFIAEYMYF